MLDLLIVLSFMAYAIYLGFKSKDDASKNLEEYFLAGKSLTGWKAGVSMAATQFAADTPLMVMGLIAMGGIYKLWQLSVYGIAFLLMGFLLSSMWRKANVITDAELCQIRYSGRFVTALRGLKAIYYGTIFNCTVIAMVLVAAMRISEVFLLWDQWLPEGFYNIFLHSVQYLGIEFTQATANADAYIESIKMTNNLISIGLILSFTILYSATGGLRSVVSTDIGQFIFAMVGTLAYAGIVIYQVGGFAALIEKIELLYGQHYADKLLSFSAGVPDAMNIQDALMPFLIILSLQWLFQMNSDGTGYLAQRSMACKSDKDARIAAALFTWLQVLVRSLLWLAIALGLMVIYPFKPYTITEIGAFTASRELLFVTGINELLPIGIKGIMLTGMLGALASTIDTHLNWGASYWSNDIYSEIICKKMLKRESKKSELINVARFSNLLVLMISLIIMFNLQSIQQAWRITLLLGTGMGSVLLLRWLWERTNLYSEFAAMLTSIILAPILLYYFQEGDQEWMRLSIMAGASTLVVVLTAFLAPQTDQKVLEEFYKKVQPKGFWGKTAIAVGDSPAHPRKLFKRAMFKVMVSSASLFLLLAGIGKLFFRPSYESPAMALDFIFLGAVLIPVWVKHLKEDED